MLLGGSLIGLGLNVKSFAAEKEGMFSFLEEMEGTGIDKGCNDTQCC